MQTSWSPEARKQEWMKLRLLRLRQVQEQSKQISKQMIEISKEKRLKKKFEIREKRDAALQEWKKTQVEELEAKYNSAMEQVGVAARQAEIENECQEKLLARRAEDVEKARQRGKLAEETHLKRLYDTMEKENAPIRRKQMIREIEDIRSGLVVQSKDWKVINQQDRKVFSDLSQASNAPRPAIKKSSLPGQATSVLKSPKVKKSPKKSRKVNDHPPTQSPVYVPAFSQNLDELINSSIETTSISPSKRGTSREGISAVQNQTTYKVSGCPCQPETRQKGTSDGQLDDRLSAKWSTTLLEGQGVQPTVRNLEINDEEINAILERYRTHYSPPSKIQSTQNDILNLTPPTHEQESPTKVKPRKRVKNCRRNSGGTTSETKKLFAAIDKALERGRRLRGELSESGSSSSSSSEEEENDNVVKLIVNVNCRQPGFEAINVEESIKNNEMTPSQRNLMNVKRPTNVKLVESKERPTNNMSKEKSTKNVSTEVGESLQASSSNSKTQSTTCSGGKDSCDSREVGASKMPQYFHYLQQPVKRTSTVEDLSRTPTKSVLHSMTDLSSIVDDSPQREIPNEVRRKVIPVIPSPVISAKAHREFSNRSLSSTVYLDLEEKLKDGPSEKEDSFQLNPVLDYYIRRLLDQPEKLGSGRSADCCGCPGVQSAANNDRLRRRPETRASTSRVENFAPEKGPDAVDVPDAGRCEKAIFDSGRDEDVNADRIKRLEKIASLERRLSEIRRVRLTSSSSSGRSSSRSSLSSHSSSPTTERLEVPMEKKHGLSTIAEADSRMQEEDVQKTSYSLPSDVAILLEKKLIDRPFKWARRGSTSSNSSIQSKLSDDDTRAEPDLSHNLPQLDFSSILSLGSEYHLHQSNAAAGNSSPPGLDISRLVSRMDLTTLSSLLDQN